MTSSTTAAASRPAETDIRMLHSAGEMEAASDLAAQIWKVESAQSHVSPELLTALAHAGNYVVGAFRGDELLAMCVGFFHPPHDNALHSHIAGVRPDAAGTGLGASLKLHQRQWCLERGVKRVTWTYDPLVARNAYFNIHKLGCEVVAYLPDFYGSMHDGLNRGQHSDRLLVSWPLDGTRVEDSAPDDPGAAALRTVDGLPVLDLRAVLDADRCYVEIPSDIEVLRRDDPRCAVQWRLALRQALDGLFSTGWTVINFDRRGRYRLAKKV